jgi:hypothetical protein
VLLNLWFGNSVIPCRTENSNGTMVIYLVLAYGCGCNIVQSFEHHSGWSDSTPKSLIELLLGHRSIGHLKIGLFWFPHMRLHKLLSLATTPVQSSLPCCSKSLICLVISQPWSPFSIEFLLCNFLYCNYDFSDT